MQEILKQLAKHSCWVDNRYTWLAWLNKNLFMNFGFYVFYNHKKQEYEFERYYG